MVRVRHENSIDNIPLHMSGRRTEERQLEMGGSKQEGEKASSKEGRREKSVGDAITAPWGAYPGDLCSSCEACPLCVPAPYRDRRPLARRARKQPPKSHFYIHSCGTVEKARPNGHA